MNEIAIIGMGCLFPEAETPEQFWENLLAKKDVTSPVSAKELGRDPLDYFDPAPGAPDKMGYLKKGSIRDFTFDPTDYKYNIPAEALLSLDKLFLWTLYAAKEALIDSGVKSFEKCGIILGNLPFPTSYSKQIFLPLYFKTLEPYVWKLLQNREFRFNTKHYLSGISPYNALVTSYPAIVTAKALGLRGPCYVIDAACASALYSIKFASYYLATGESDIMLAGGICGPDPIYINSGFNMLRALPPDGGESIPLDTRSQGVKLSEGAGIVVLKRYRDAIRDNDHIYGVIENIGLSNDGGAQHILMPDKAGQIRSLTLAYENRSETVDYIECHATGTPLGDRVELEALEEFFVEKRLPLFGANKANMGHMLTASGMPGLFKVLLSMAHDMIPATIGIRDLVRTERKRIGADHIVSENMAWPKQGALKRAGINAFGFGGANAHILIREHPRTGSSHVVAVEPEKKDSRLAIVGMSAFFGGIDGIEAFYDSIYHGTSHFIPLPSPRWFCIDKNNPFVSQCGFEDGHPPNAAYLNQVEIDCMKLKIPPKMAQQPLVNHLLAATIAIQACNDAGFDMENDHRNTAVISILKTDPRLHRVLFRSDVAWQLRESLEQCHITLDQEKHALLENIVKDSISHEPYFEGCAGGIGNLAASRIASVLGFRGPALTIASQENAFFKAMELARFLLCFEKIDAVVLGSLDISGSPESVLSNSSLYTMRGRKRKKERVFGEGGGAIVVKRYGDAKKAGNRIYAIAHPPGIVQEHESGELQSLAFGDGVYTSCKKALANAHIEPGCVEYIELHGSGIEDEDIAEREGIAKAYAKNQRTGDICIGSVKANIGHTFSTSGIASVIKTSLALFHGFLPASVQELTGLGNEPGFSAKSVSEKWIPERNTRFAAVNALGADGSYSHLILEEPDQNDRKRAEQFEEKLQEYEKTKKHQKSFIKTLNISVPRISDTMFTKDSIETFRSANQIPFVFLSTAKKPSSLPFVLLSTADTTSDIGATGKEKRIVWDQAQLIEMATGSVSKVLGPAYKKTDTYLVRARMPSPPFMFATRVTNMTAQKGNLKPFMICWEYDIPQDAWYVVNDAVPLTILAEASHTLISGLSYMGCDEMFDGKLKYRAIDNTLVVYDYEAAPGDMFFGKVKVTSFVKTNANLLLFFEFDGYINKRRLFTIHSIGGFFSPEDMEQSKGLDSMYKPEAIPKNGQFTPLLDCTKHSFTHNDIEDIQSGDFQKGFGPNYHKARHCTLAPPKLLMLDRVISVDPHAGNFGLGLIIGEKDISPDHWVFNAHFKNDPVLPGTVIGAGIFQTLVFYIYYLGLHTLYSDCKIALPNNSTSNMKFRGEVKKSHTTLTYRLIIKSIDVSESVYVVADAEVIHKGKIIVSYEDLAAMLVET